jgi:serine/threonine-protein kinase
LEPGSYDIQLSKKGYESQEIGGVLVVRGQTELIEDQLVQMVGKLKIQSSPAEAEIKLNGKSYGTTPNVVANLAVGDYELELSKEGYQPYQQTVRVEQKTTEINHQLKDKPKFETGEMGLIPGRGRIFRQPAFYMDKYEVTNAQYRKFVQATGHRAPLYWNDPIPGRGRKFNQPNQPVVTVSWHDATAYAKWVGKRLPTEKEWEWAARAEKEWEWAARGGLKGKKYPWGNQEPSASRANYGRKRRNPTAVGNYPANGYGLHDMAGNVWEWCQDWYDRDKEHRVLRGGSWDDDPITLRVSFRGGDYPDDRRNDVGFRCVSGSK